MFSLRTRWDLTANALALAVEGRREKGLPLADLTESNPTRVGLALDGDALVAAFAHFEAGVYQPEPRGLLTAREAVQRTFLERGHDVALERLFLTASTSEAYAFLFKLLCDPGDEILVPRPSYPLFEFLAGLESVTTRGYPLSFDGEWHLERSNLLGELGPRTRAIVVVSPNNPTGSFLKRRELQLLEEVAGERGIAVISDEVFADYGRGAKGERVSVLDAPGLFSFALGGLSKGAALPQVKVGWLAANGPAPLVEEALRRLEIIADTYLSVSTPSQLALPSLLAQRGEIQRRIRDRVEENFAALSRAIVPGDPVGLLPLEGGWSAVLRIPRTRSEQAWVVTLVEEDGVLVHPGFFFDFPGEGYLSVSLLPRPEEFARAALRLLARLRR